MAAKATAAMTKSGRMTTTAGPTPTTVSAATPMSPSSVTTAVLSQGYGGAHHQRRGHDGHAT
jgi:hypothetical protein